MCILPVPDCPLAICSREFYFWPSQMCTWLQHRPIGLGSEQPTIAIACSTWCFIFCSRFGPCKSILPATFDTSCGSLQPRRNTSTGCQRPSRLSLQTWVPFKHFPMSFGFAVVQRFRLCLALDTCRGSQLKPLPDHLYSILLYRLDHTTDHLIHIEWWNCGTCPSHCRPTIRRF